MSEWAEAHREASERGWPEVSTDLVLLGLTRKPGVASDVLAELGATEQAVLRVLAKLKPVAPNGHEDELKPIDSHAASIEAIEARGRAAGIAIGLGTMEESVHLLLALAYSRTGPATRVLQALGIDRSAIVAGVAARGIEVPSLPVPADPAPKTVLVVLTEQQATVVVDELLRLSVEDPDRFFDRDGGGSWGHGLAPNQPGMHLILAEPRIDLRTIVIDAIRSAGLSEPPESAWASSDDGPPPLHRISEVS